MKPSNKLPELNYVGNEEKKLTLHLFFQILGKIRMCFASRKNHWWYITLYVYEKGFTTGPISINNGFDTFSLNLNILQSRLEITKSSGETKEFDLYKGLSVATFYNNVINFLEDLEIQVEIKEKPYDLNIDKEFSEITDIHNYDKEYSTSFWKTFQWVDSAFKEFSGRFYGKTCPIHLYWHSMDLAVTRFSGKKAPEMAKEARISDRDAYTHECISFGFWAGDKNVQEPAFYSYTYPGPENMNLQELNPKTANWVLNNGSYMAILTYADLKKENNPRNVLLDFMESAYQAGAKLAGWDVKTFEVPTLKDL
ncbi:DUF5996 family protein [Christiangramia forsetii]|uniref:Uncharacterized protein n=2 Tax=Christiangramia forsetii TaxID=411153 RepID=A0M6T7_CHRFK|nr:DUF5996 family protein [Christiangramia forsetii]GGG29555.1 hypothetical protein GCM10011532_11290 [Christiangramia forsetii]CAL68332.1 conserved hypothetical protein [Christiangramia forsetii KT0803]